MNEREKKYTDKKALDEEFKLLNSLGITKKPEMKGFGIFSKKLEILFFY